MQPIMPNKAAELLDALGVRKEKRSLADATLCADDSYGDVVEVSSKGKFAVLFPPLVNDL